MRDLKPVISFSCIFGHLCPPPKWTQVSGSLCADKYQNSEFHHGTGNPEQTQWGKITVAEADNVWMGAGGTKNAGVHRDLI